MSIEIDYDLIKYEVTVDKLEKLNKDLLEQEIILSKYEEQIDIKKYNEYLKHPIVINYLELTNIHNEISHKIGLLKKKDKDNPNINLLIEKARSIKEQINIIKEYDVVVEYLKLLKNYRVKYYLSAIKDKDNIKKQINNEENKMNELNNKVRKKILIKKD